MNNKFFRKDAAYKREEIDMVIKGQKTNIKKFILEYALDFEELPNFIIRSRNYLWKPIDNTNIIYEILEKVK